jgi:hypothetical protein
VFATRFRVATEPKLPRLPRTRVSIATKRPDGTRPSIPTPAARGLPRGTMSGQRRHEAPRGTISCTGGGRSPPDGIRPVAKSAGCVGGDGIRSCARQAPWDGSKVPARQCAKCFPHGEAVAVVVMRPTG